MVNSYVQQSSPLLFPSTCSSAIQIYTGRQKNGTIMLLCTTFNMQCNVTKFGALAHKWIVNNATNWFLSSTLIYAIYLAKSLTSHYNVINHQAQKNCWSVSNEMPEFIPPSLWPLKSPGLNPLDYGTWQVMQDRVHKTKIDNVDELKQRIVRCGMRWNRPWQTDLSISGTKNCKCVLELATVKLNI